jgi:hypothetical protein
MIKRLTYLALILLLMLWFVQPVHATGVTTVIKGPSSIEPNQQFDVIIGVRNAPSIFGLSATFSYDASKLEIVSVTQLNEFTTTIGPSIIIDKATSNSGTFDFVRITFKATSGFSIDQTTTISLTKVSVPDGSGDLKATDASLRITMTAPKSSNNFLSSLSVSQGTLNFNKNTTSYTVVVDHDISSITINGAVEDTKASVAGLGTKTLRIYENRFAITVTAENGNRRTYNVLVVRRDQDGNAGALSQNNRLTMLDIEGCTIDFDSEITDYECEVSNLMDVVVVDAKAEDQNAEITVSNTSLEVGSNTITIMVKAPSGDERVYQLMINRSHLAPVVSLNQFFDALKAITSPDIIMDLENRDTIENDVLSAIKEANKILIAQASNDQHVLYQWKIDGSQVDNHQLIRTKLMFTSEYQAMLDTLTRFTKGKVLVFQTNEALPNGTQVGINVSDEYEDNHVLNLYLFDTDTQTLTLKLKGLVVEQGFIWIPLTHTSQYFLTPATLNESTTNPWMLATGLLFVVLLLLIGILATKFKAIKALYLK